MYMKRGNKMRAGFIEKEKIAYFKNVKEPVIKNARDVKIQVKITGICGSEIHAYHGKHPFRIPPLVSGHEFSGIVVEVGEDVTKCEVGDRVTAEPHYGCGKCGLCKIGKYNLCLSKEVLGATNWSGSFGEYIVVPEDTIVHLEDKISYEEGALIEPIAVGMHAIRRYNLNPKTRILIIGGGTIGLGLLLCAKSFNPSQIIVTDIEEFNLTVARQLGCNHAINNDKVNLEHYIKDITDGEGVDITFLAFGNSEVVELASRCTRVGGEIAQIAIMPNGWGFPYGVVQRNELSFTGSNMYTYSDFQAVKDAINTGTIDVKKLISAIYPIEDFSKAMQIVDKRSQPIIKLLLKF